MKQIKDNFPKIDNRQERAVTNQTAKGHGAFAQGSVSTLDEQTNQNKRAEQSLADAVKRHPKQGKGVSINDGKVASVPSNPEVANNAPQNQLTPTNTPPPPSPALQARLENANSNVPNPAPTNSPTPRPM